MNNKDKEIYQEKDDLLEELQALWDDQGSRMERVLAANPGAVPHGMDLRQGRPYRRKLMGEYVALALLNVAVGTLALLLLVPDTYILLTMTGYVLAAVSGLLSLYTMYMAVALWINHPSRVGTSQMSRLIRRMHLSPHYAPQPGRRVKEVDFLRGANNTFTTARQVAAVSASVITVLVTVSCAPLGDGHAMTGTSRGDRAQAVSEVEQILSQI